MADELKNIEERYSKRSVKSSLYSPLNPAVYMMVQEKERALIRWINSCGLAPVQDRKVLEIGCGNGGNLFKLIELGFRPENLIGNELLPERVKKAREVLPASTRVVAGDASTLDLPEGYFDIVFQSTVFSSILDEGFREKLARRMWALAKPGGGVLWYDFIYDNPRNPDVRGVRVKRIGELFPKGSFKIWRLTLAPPVARRVSRVHPAFYTLFNLFPALRTHVLCWIKKPG